MGIFSPDGGTPGQSGMGRIGDLSPYSYAQERNRDVQLPGLGYPIGVNPKAVYNALTALEREGIITANRERGSFAEVTMLVEPEP